jgi:hypothetical protein
MENNYLEVQGDLEHHHLEAASREGLGFTPTLLCHKCAVRFGPMCAKVRLFNTNSERFRAGFFRGK